MSFLREMFAPKKTLFQRYQEYSDDYDSKQSAALQSAIGSPAVEGRTGLAQMGGPDGLISDTGDYREAADATGEYRGASLEKMRRLDYAKDLAKGGFTDDALAVMQEFKAVPVTKTNLYKDYNDAVNDGSWSIPERGGIYEYDMSRRQQENPSHSPHKRDKTIKDNYMYVSDGAPVSDLHTSSQLAPFLESGEVMAVSAKNQEKIQGFNQIVRYYDNLDDQLFGQEGIWQGYEELPGDASQMEHLGRVGRLSWLSAVNTVSQKDPRFRQYNKMADAFSGFLYRLTTGEVGNLSEGDVQRAKGMIPRFTDIKNIMPWSGESNTYVTDLPQVAKMKMEYLKSIVSSWQGDLIRGVPLNTKILDDAERAISEAEQEAKAEYPDYDPSKLKAPEGEPLDPNSESGTHWFDPSVPEDEFALPEGMPSLPYVGPAAQTAADILSAMPGLGDIAKGIEDLQYFDITSDIQQTFMKNMDEDSQKFDGILKFLFETDEEKAEREEMERREKQMEMQQMPPQ